MAEWIGSWTVNVAVSSVQGLLVDVEQTHAFAFAHHSVVPTSLLVYRRQNDACANDSNGYTTIPVVLYVR